jgi:hypothetical protein
VVNAAVAAIITLSAQPGFLAVDGGIWQDEAVGIEADAAIDGQEAWLRAERDEGGNGRVYHIAFSATYPGGGTCEHEVLVTVPPAKGATSIDDGPLADSTKP